MIPTGLFIALLCIYQAKAQGTFDDEIPFVVASPDSIKDSNEPDAPPIVVQQAPTEGGRSDIAIEKEPAQGYVYPKPSNPLVLPPFTTLDSTLSLDGSSSFTDDGNIEVERSRRSPQRRPNFGGRGGGGRGSRGPRGPRPYFGMRPLPALYGRPNYGGFF